MQRWDPMHSDTVLTHVFLCQNPIGGKNVKSRLTHGRDWPKLTRTADCAGQTRQRRALSSRREVEYCCLRHYWAWATSSGEIPRSVVQLALDDEPADLVRDERTWDQVL